MFCFWCEVCKINPNETTDGNGCKENGMVNRTKLPMNQHYCQGTVGFLLVEEISLLSYEKDLIFQTGWNYDDALLIFIVPVRVEFELEISP